MVASIAARIVELVSCVVVGNGSRMSLRDMSLSGYFKRPSNVTLSNANCDPLLSRKSRRLAKRNIEVDATRRSLERTAIDGCGQHIVPRILSDLGRSSN